MDNDRHLDDPDGNGGDGVVEKDEEDVDDDDEVDADDVDHNINEVDIDVVNKRMRKMLMMLVKIMLRLMSMMKKLKLLMSSLGPRPRRSVGGEGAQGDLGFRGLFQDITTSASSTSEQISIILGVIQNRTDSQIALANIYEEKNAFHHQERLARSLGHTTLVDTILPLQRI